jgi:hypothetical protein
MKVFLKRGLIAVVVLAVLGVAGLFLFLDRFVASAIEKGSTYAAGVDTKVGEVDAGPMSGKFGMKELSIANPPGFGSQPFFRLGSAHAAWQNGSILSKTIEIDEFVVQDVDVSLESSGTATNYGKILDNLGKLSSGGEKAPAPQAPAEKSGKSLLIKKLEFQNVRASVHLAGLPLAKGAVGGEVKIPSIVVENFRSDGSTTEIVAKLTRTMLQSVLQGVLAEGKNSLPADIAKGLGQDLHGLEGSVKSGDKSAIEGAVKDLGGLFKKK